MEKILVNTDETFERLVTELKDTDTFAYDTETNGTFDQFKMQMVGMSFAFGENAAYYLPLFHEKGEQLWYEKVIPVIKPFFENPDIQKVCHNAKFDEKVVLTQGIEVKGDGHDTMIMAWLLDEKAHGSLGLKPLTKRHFGVEMQTYEDVIMSVKKSERNFSFAPVAVDDAVSYAADDAYYCLKLFRKFESQLRKEQIWGAYKNVEMPFSRILRDIELKGVAIDIEALEYADKRLPEIAEKVEADIYEAAGEVFNIGSPKQLGDILFDKLKIGWVKTPIIDESKVPKSPKTGNYKTDKKTLETYAKSHKIVENVLRRKKIQKTHSTFVVGIKDFIAKDGRVHPSFNGSGTATGRLSGSKPNLQQIEGDEVEEIKVRNFFKASPGCDLIVADYSQVELRVMAHFSKDRNMSEAFNSGAAKFHDEMAKRIFNLASIEEVTRQQKLAAKTLNFGVPYGRGAPGVAEQLGVSKQKGQEFIDEWFATFPGVAAYSHHLIAQTRKRGYVRTLTGRKRVIPDMQSDNWGRRTHAERQAFNTQIQGSAADIIKMAMIALRKPLLEYNAHMIIQIHDELVIESPKEYTQKALATTKQIMEAPHRGKNPLRIPLVTEPTVVEYWGDAK